MAWWVTIPSHLLQSLPALFLKALASHLHPPVLQQRTHENRGWKERNGMRERKGHAYEEVSASQDGEHLGFTSCVLFVGVLSL